MAQGKKNWIAGAVHESKKGMFDNTTTKDLMKMKSHLSKTGPHKRGSPKAVKTAEVNFALRARHGGFSKK